MSRVEQGVVDAVRKDNKGLNVAGTWYSAFNAFSGISKGDVVSFDFTEKGQWKNIKGPIERVTGNSPAQVGSVGTANSENAPELPDHYITARGYLTKVQSFPVPADHPDRAIIRQNSLTNAVNLYTGCFGQHVGSGVSTIDLAEVVLDIAQIFERYSTGDIEKDMATAMLGEATAPAEE